jgi:hypothetical protein
MVEELVAFNERSATLPRLTELKHWNHGTGLFQQGATQQTMEKGRWHAIYLQNTSCHGWRKQLNQGQAKQVAPYIRWSLSLLLPMHEQHTYRALEARLSQQSVQIG